MPLSVCLSVCLSGWTQGTLYTTTPVFGLLVHQEGAICTTQAQYAPRCTRETMLPCFRVKVKGRGQGHESRSKVTGQGQRSRSNFWRAAVDIRGSALPSAAKSNKGHYQCKVFVCVSVISGHRRIIARRRSIGFFYIQLEKVFSKLRNLSCSHYGSI